MIVSRAATPAAASALSAPRTLSSLQPKTTHLVTFGLAVMTGAGSALRAVSTVASEATG